MENKKLWIRRSIYIIFFGLTLVLLSFYGGNVPYMLFGAIVIHTIVLLVYILYVFLTIKIYQSVPERQVTKNELVDYRLFLNNESFLAYQDVTLRFMDGLSEIKGTDFFGHLNLEPGQGIEKKMELVCKYSGTFFVGVDTVEIMDYFKIFKIRFPMPQKMKVTVKPRILMPQNVSFITQFEECHEVSLTRKSNDLIDSSVRKYFPGDNKKLIHWKNSAKRQEIMLRTMTAEEILKYVIVMDDTIAALDTLEGILQSDKLRELTLAMVHYIFNLGLPVEVFLGQRYQNEIMLSNDFQEVYEVLTEYEFRSKQNMNILLEDINKTYDNNVSFVFITAQASKYDLKFLEELNLYRKVHLLDVNSFDNIDEFLHIEERNKGT